MFDKRLKHDKYKNYHKMFLNRLQLVNGKYTNTSATHKIKICKECKHYNKNGQVCNLYQTIDVITGQAHPASATDIRKEPTLCGMGASYFEPIKIKYYFEPIKEN